MDAKLIKEKIEGIPRVVLLQMDAETIRILQYIAAHIEEWNVEELAKM